MLIITAGCPLRKRMGNSLNRKKMNGACSCSVFVYHMVCYHYNNNYKSFYKIEEQDNFISIDVLVYIEISHFVT